MINEQQFSKGMQDLKKRFISNAIRASRDNRLELDKWCQKHIRIKGKPFSFKFHEYLLELYRDIHPFQVYKKAAQVAISTRNVLEAFWLGDAERLNILYYFQTGEASQDFTQGRIDPLISDNAYLAERFSDSFEEDGPRKKNTDNVRIKKFGDSMFYFRGIGALSKNKTAVKTVDGDAAYLDELDEANQENREFIRDRLLHSELGWYRELSQPSFPGVGIDEVFARSDQRFCLFRCPSCGYENILEEELEDGFVPKCLIETPSLLRKTHGTCYRGCVKCAHPLNLYSPVWVAKRPDVTNIRGYHVSQLYSQIVQGGRDIAESFLRQLQGAIFNPKKKKRFVISVIGNAYGGVNQPVTASVIEKNMGDHGLVTHRGSYAGIDVGDRKHIKIGYPNNLGGVTVTWVETTDSWDRIAKLLIENQVIYFVVDAMPYKESSVKLCDQFPGLGAIHFYKEGKTVKVTEEHNNSEVPVIKTDRTDDLDELCAQVTDGTWVFPNKNQLDQQQLGDWDEMVKNFGYLIWNFEETAKGVTVRKYLANVPNHFGMAANYLLKAIEFGSQFSGPGSGVVGKPGSSGAGAQGSALQRLRSRFGKS